MYIATLTPNRPNNWTNARYSQMIMVTRHQLVTLVDGHLTPVVDVRIYKSYSGLADGASPTYCSFWVNALDIAGSGDARGYGYDKPSGAFASALTDAGVVLTKPDGSSADIGGRGDSAIHTAMEALARVVYPEMSMFVIV